MNRIKLLLVPGLLFLIAFVGALNFACGGDDNGAPKEVQLTDAGDGSTVQLARGGKLIVALQSNASTGYAWSVAEGSGSGLELSGEPRYVPPGSTSPVVGAPGTQVFTFEAREAGTTHLALEYKRSFEPANPPARTFKVTVDVR